MTRRLLSAGEVVVDLVLSVPRLPERGGDVVAQSVATEVGGAFNVMAAAARQGVPVSYAGLLGTGPMADLAAAALRREGIAPAVARHHEGDTDTDTDPDPDTGTIVTLVEPGGERTFVTTLGAEARLRPADLATVAVRPDDVVHLSGYGLAYPVNGPTLAAWVGELPAGVTLVFDPGPLVADVPASLLAAVLGRCDWLSCNAAEATALDPDAGQHRPDVVAERLSATHGCGVVVRVGDQGAVVATPQSSAVHVPPFVVNAVDLNGAGDAHVGSFIASIALLGPTFDPVVAVRRANVAGALAVTRRGPATAATTAEIDAFDRDE